MGMLGTTSLAASRELRFKLTATRNLSGLVLHFGENF